MTTEDPPNDAQDTTALVPAGSPETSPVAAGEPTLPKGMTPEEGAELKARSAAIVNQLDQASGSKEMEMVDSITAVGIQAQKQAGAELNLLRGQVADILSNEGTGGQVTKDLVDLRVALNEINPNENQSGIRRILNLLPFHKSLLNILERIAIRYETVAQQVLVIEKRLQDGRMMLRRDNIELRKLYEQVESQQVPIVKNAYFGELLMQQLDELLARTTDSRKRQRIQSALYDVSMRVQDLHTMVEVDTQFFVSIDMTRENNTRLGESVDRTLSLATNTLMVGLAIQSALARQKRVLEANQRTQEFLGDLIVGNAAAIKQHTAEIGDAYKNPVVAIEKLTQAHNDLVEALDMAERLKTEGIDAARENIAKLKQLADQLDQKAGEHAEQREPASLEA